MSIKLSMPTDQELELASTFIHYELQKLLYMRRANPAAEKRQGITSDHYERNLWHTCNTATLEAFLLHYRNLRDFLNNKGNDRGRYPDDVLARHFAPNWTGTTNILPVTANEDVRLNKLLAHISYRRYELKPGDWPLTLMLENICTVMERFIASVPIQRKLWFDRCTVELRNRERPGSSSAMMLDGNATATVSVWKWSPFDTELIFKR
jgi:hypothetical protein